MAKWIVVAFAVVVVVAVAWIYWLGGGGRGEYWGTSAPRMTPIEAETLSSRAAAIRGAADGLGVSRPKQILFGDLHVHSTFSLDAFMMALPSGGGEGAHPVNDACDFARYCSELDFWSINDHAIGLTPRNWDDTIAAIRQCNEVAPNPSDPDVSAFLGWEWTQMGSNPSNHYGHKNVIIKGLADGEVPARPIAARAPLDAWDRQPDAIMPGRLAIGLFTLYQPGQDTHDLVRYFDKMVGVPDCADGVPVRELSRGCRESTFDPSGLFAKLDDWGFASMVIPHGTTWGLYTPHGSAWDKQLVGPMHDSSRQRLIEVYSGHGNSEEYRDWREVEFDADGEAVCPLPRDDFLPSCWQAGVIIAGRCLAAGESEAECERRAEDARRLYLEGDIMGHLTVPGVDATEWLDSDQCRDCFQPSFNYRPKSSVQYTMALRNFDDPAAPRRFEFGFMAASDNHTARPGTGYKEVARIYNTEARLAEAGGRFMGQALPMEPLDPEPRALPFTPDRGGSFFNLREAERASSFFLTGGLMAVHSEGRDRDSLWQAMERKEVYGTSGPRILLWFDLLNPPGSGGGVIVMGGETELSAAPIFRVRAVGSFEQEPGCPEAPMEALGAADLERLCRGECYNPSDRRRLITRIEVVKIRPQEHEDEPVDALIEDAWRVFPCAPDATGCSVTFSDPDFRRDGRDALYYVRAIEAPAPAVNAGLLRCETDQRGRCLRTDACIDSRTARDDDCLAETEQRAWSSPIFVAHGAAGR